MRRSKGLESGKFILRIAFNHALRPNNSPITREPQNKRNCYFIFLYKFIYFNWRLITLQYCIGFAIHQHESAMGVHVFSILKTPSHLPPHTIPLGHPSAPAPSIKFKFLVVIGHFFFSSYHIHFLY